MTTKYAIAEAKVNQVGAVVAAAEETLEQVLNTAQYAVTMIDKALDGATEIAADIDAQTAAGDDVWKRLKARKDEIAANVADSRARAVAIVAAIQAVVSK